MSDLCFQSASELADRIKNRSLSSSELLERYLARVQALDSKTNAVVTLDEDRARARAQELDSLAAQQHFIGPLHGLPITVKDTFETEGIRTTAGSLKLKDHSPTENALAVQRLLDAGAVIFGKTNTPTFAADIQTNNPVFGRTNNPWDLSRTCGGSSGGSAVSTAMAFSAFEMGSDIGGSLRIPASFCGAYTIKTSYGIIPTAGMLSTTRRNFNVRDISCIGPFARSAKDLSLVLDVLAGPNPMEAEAWQLKLPRSSKPIQEYRVAAWLDDDFCSVDNAVLERLQKTTEELERKGVAIDYSARPDFSIEEATDLYIQCLSATGVSDMPERAMEKRRSTINDYPLEMQTGLAYKSVQYSLMDAHKVAKAKEAQAQLRDKWRQFFSRYDILLCPVSPTTAFPHIDTDANFFSKVKINNQLRDYAELWVWIGALAGVAYLPAVSAPIGTTADGLPVGLQIIAPYLHDHSAINFADQLASINGGFQPPPLAVL